MTAYKEIALLLAGFMVVAIASSQIAKVFQKIRLPLVTGLLITGIISGPFVLGLVPKKLSTNLNFLNEFSLAFIAFAAGAELYLKELRSRLKSIKWMTFGQFVVTFILSSIAVYFLADRVPFMQGMSKEVKLAVAILTGTIFVARSPSSAIAVINEMRAKGPFTQTVMGVTVVKDVLVIILFAVCFAVSDALVTGVQFDIRFLLILLFELALSFGIGILLGKLLQFILSFRLYYPIKTGAIVVSGYSAYLLAHFVRHYSEHHWGFELLIEPLLICIIGSFVVTNYSKYRLEFMNILHRTGPLIYVIFFTLAGTSLSLDVLPDIWTIALLFFAIRLGTMVIGGFVGGYLGGDPWKYNKIAWMPYVTQAGVALGLATIVANEFTGWGSDFATLIIAVVVLNEMVGPTLFKAAISYVKEDHRRAEAPAFSGGKDAIIFGLESQSLALARQLKENGWGVKIVSRKATKEEIETSDIDIFRIDTFTFEEFETVAMQKADAIVTMLSDDENYKIVELVYEKVGTKDMIVRLNDRKNFERFHKLGALIVEPATAMVSLLDHFVRSPQATSLLLGMEKDQDSIDVEVQCTDLHGIALRDLHLPTDIIILSIRRAGQMLISHGYTRLRKGDMVTVVGSLDSLENVKLRFSA